MKDKEPVFTFLFNMKKILSIEDDSSLQNTLVSFLQKQNYEVFSCSDGEKGLLVAKKELPDLIILDLIIPRLDGLGVLKELKKDESTKHIPVIITTNLEKTEDIEKATEEGASVYLIKNQYSLKELLEKIKENLQ